MMTGDDLRAHRRRMQLDQQQMAAALNTPYGTYRGWETGRVSVPGIVDVALRMIGETLADDAGAEKDHG
jgi:DNA-binding transcriptional regulator YiaG